jgi:hypothetical protein
MIKKVISPPPSLPPPIFPQYALTLTLYELNNCTGPVIGRPNIEPLQCTDVFSLFTTYGHNLEAYPIGIKYIMVNDSYAMLLYDNDQCTNLMVNTGYVFKAADSCTSSNQFCCLPLGPSSYAFDVSMTSPSPPPPRPPPSPLPPLQDSSCRCSNVVFANNTNLKCNQIKSLFQNNILTNGIKGCCQLPSRHLDVELNCCNIKCEYIKNLYVESECCTHHENSANIIV